MNRFMKIAAAALTATLVLGGTGAATAANHGPAHKHAKQTKQHSGGKSSQAANAAARRLEVARRVTQHDISVKDARLAHAVTVDELADLPADVVSALAANRDADRAALAGWSVEAAVATTREELAAIRSAVRAVRPEVYAVTVAAVRQALALESQLATIESTIDLATADVAVLDLLAAGHLAVSTVLAEALLVSGLGGHAAVRPVQVALESAAAAVAAVVAALAPAPVEPVV